MGMEFGQVRVCGLAAFLAVLSVSGLPATLPAQDVNQAPRPNRALVVVTGAPGLPHYEALFGEWADQWQSAGQSAGFRVERIGNPKADRTAREQLQETLEREVAGSATAELWIVLIGHGTFDGNIARFNLTGPDVSATELAEWIAPRTQLTVIINCASACAPFAAALTGERRVIVTATQSGFETNFTRFGRHMVESIADPALDLDKDEQVSLLESFIGAASKTRDFYVADKRLATEHAMLEDNGDGLGTPFDWFRGTRVVVKARENQEADGRLANQVFFFPGELEEQLTAAQRAERERLEGQIESLRARKPAMNEDEYYRLLEPIMLELARLYFPEGTSDD